MLEALPLIAVTVCFISIFLYAYANLQLEEIRTNWDERRCEALVMLLANMVPTDPSIDPSAFAAENFQFCMGKIIDSSLSIMLQPMMASFSGQIDATKPISNAMNNLKNAAFSLLSPLLSIFGNMWGKMKNASFEIFRVYYNIHMAMDRIFGIAAASLFAGMGLFNAIKNGMGFVLQVIIAILIILCILVIYLFFIMWPVIPIILTMIGILSATVYSANVSGMSGSFCVGPDTLVKIGAKKWKRVSEIRPGDALADGFVEGVLQVGKPAHGTCVSIKNVIISKSHLVFHNGWISAGEHPDAKPAESPNTLYCLNTSSRIWEVKCVDSDSSLTLRDWEELPESEQTDLAWESLVSNILNGSDKTLHTSSPGRGLLGPGTLIWALLGPTPITQIKIGDYVMDSTGFTKVLGIYKDIDSVPESGPTHSVWYYMIHKRVWTHAIGICKSEPTHTGYHLVTESGSFKIGFASQRMLVRDFTEVGANRIHETYPFVKSIL
jgi:hypothetical protein